MPYRKIDTRLWNDEKIRRLSRDARDLYLYLLTSPHSTPWGAYVIDDMYIVADTAITISNVQKAVSELLANRLLLRCERTRLVAFPNWFKYNPPVNQKSAIACIRGILDLPKSSVLSRFCESSKWVSEQLANYDLTNFEKLDHEQEQEQEQEQEHKKEKTNKKEKKPAHCPKRIFPEWINETLLNEYVKHREALKKPMTEKAIDLAIKALDRFRTEDGLDPNEIIEQSIANGWQGLFAPKQQQTARKEKKDARHKPDYTKTGGFVTD